MKKLSSQKALVIFSGGQDSTTCLFWAMQNFMEVYALSFDYGQRHRIELDAARTIAAKTIGAEKHLILALELFNQIGEHNSLVTKDIDFNESTSIKNVSSKKPCGKQLTQSSLPDSFVPGRNLLFINIAAIYAYKIDAANIITGVSQSDYSGYPDCRDDSIKSLQVSLNLGMESNFTIHTPLMWLTKAQSILLAEKLGALESLAFSHSCYHGQNPPCEHCAACQLRAKGFAEAGIVDPLLKTKV